MIGQLPPSLSRLARSNPVQADDHLGQSAAARAGLRMILASERSGRRHPVPRRSRRVLVLALAALLLAVGGALAATDPFGLFRSPNPGTAIYGVDVNHHVVPPTGYQIECPRTGVQAFRCGADLGGRRYTLLDHVQANGPRLTRAFMAHATRRAVRSGQLSSQTAKRFEADFAAVSDDFLARLSDLMRYGTLTTSLTSGNTRPLAPPLGVPALLVCVPAGKALSCQDLNGDDHAAIGSGIYQAVPSADWRPAPPHQRDPSWQLEVAILGHPPTPAEFRVLIDLSTGTSQSSSGSVTTTTSPTTQAP
jgi:hypothetical protein